MPNGRYPSEWVATYRYDSLVDVQPHLDLRERSECHISFRARQHLGLARLAGRTGHGEVNRNGQNGSVNFHLNILHCICIFRDCPLRDGLFGLLIVYV